MNGSPSRTADTDGWTSAEIDEDYGNDLLNCCLKIQRYNSSVMDRDGMISAMEDISGRKLEEGTLVVFPFRCDLGYNVHLGKGVIVNYNCTFLDTASITIGDYSKIGPDCHFVTATHPMDYLGRRKHLVKGEPITVGKDCWIGANVTIVPGVKIGDRCVIGAGSVVTKDVPDDSVYAGNPAHSIKK
ncbi:MAG: sugar O-acetyltransferase [Candidatus Methanomethylophilaceae archaeon]|nr:sugar O-acetyltransferase [Candidatus Methanomethylophilaceae archaeon]